MLNKLEFVTVENAGKAALRKLLKLGIEKGQVWPAFQPIVDIRTGAVASFEVLARWSDPCNGEIGPMTFIPRLEQHGLIDMLFEALIGRACGQAVMWPGKFSLAFNISPVQLTCEEFPHRLAKLVASTGFPLNRVELEVTEGSLISDDNRAYAILHALNVLGVKIAIDDFGTGYSSLARLESFPFHKIKIDRRFVDGLNVEPSKRRIAAAVIGLGKSLGITTVAEGIETAAQEAILRNLGCDLGQGWLYGKGERSDEALGKLKHRGVSGECGRPLDTSPFQQFHQLATLYDQAPVGLCFVDMDLRHVRANDRFASMHGLTGAELEGKTLREVLEGGNLETAERILRESASSDEPRIQRYVFGGRNMLIFNTRVKDFAGDVIGFSIVAVDTTEENRLSQELREERDYANAILDSLPGTFYHYGPDLKLQRWNRNLERVTGYKTAELHGFDLLDFFVEEERPIVEDAIRSVFENRSGMIEAKYLLKDGTHLPYVFTGVRFEYKGADGFVGVAMDISERKGLEQRLRHERDYADAVINSLPGIFFYYDDQMRLRRWNQNHEKSTGYTGEELMNRSPLDFFDDEGKEQIAQAMQQVFTEGHTQIEATFLDKHGEGRPYLFTGSRLLHGGRMGFVGTGTDISELKAVQRELRNKSAILETLVDVAPDRLLAPHLDGVRATKGHRPDEFYQFPDEIVTERE
ncbi:EAL domain-containing protein (plasmid) [Rhizobium sp. CB3060]|uniref:EAL domain-containing protein n=1 Tax=Rhizobium sp. CB3060 TaxID=3138255 RepID=UPI0021A2EC35|nr:EAL domain-containing protein [Rhizobium tropici]UWU26083.1 EAL domain-containing protein [Rhizobium tropici]